MDDLITMEETCVFDILDICWAAILQETESAFFKEEHCNITDSRDTNFNKIESRQAYIYKFGYFNIQYFKECISKFLVECSELEAVFPFENLKVCSLSNGPGFDIIGLLCALWKSEKNLKCFPHLKAINLYDSWLNLFKIIVKKAYEEISLKSFVEYFHMPSENVHLIQSDVYSTLSPESENLISDSNVLLMMNIFTSTKATADVLTSTLRKIFTLLKPGALIFYVGSKRSTKIISKDDSPSSLVKCIFGPQKVTLYKLRFFENLSSNFIVRIFREYFCRNPFVKPQDCGCAYFVVWQKRDIDVALEVTKTKKKKTRRKKRKALGTVQMQKENSNELLDDTDAGSEVSFSSCSKQSDSLCDEIKNGSLTNVSDEMSVKNSEKEFQNTIIHPVDSVTPLLKDIDIKDSNNIENNIQIKKLMPVITEDIIKPQPLKDVFSKEESIKQMKNGEASQDAQNAVFQSVKECISNDKIYLDHSVSGAIKKCITDKNQIMFSAVIQNAVHKESDTPNKKSAKVNSSEVNAEIKSDNNVPEATQQSNISVHQSCKQSNSLCDEIKKHSLTNISDEMSVKDSEKEFQNTITYPVDSVITHLKEIDMKDSNNIENNIQVKEFMPVITEDIDKAQPLKNVCSKEESMEQMTNRETSQNAQNLVFQSLKECISDDKVYLDHSVSGAIKNCITDMDQSMFSPVLQNEVYKRGDTPNKKVSKKTKSTDVISSEMNAEIKNDNTIPKATLQSNISVNQSHKQSYSLCDEIKKGSLTIISDEMSVKDSEKEFQNTIIYPVDYVVPFLKEIDIKDSNNIENNIQVKELMPDITEDINKTQPLKNVCSKEESMKQMENGETNQNAQKVIFQSLKECISGDEVYLDHSVSGALKNCITDMDQSMFSPVIQNEVYKRGDTPNKKGSKKKMCAKVIPPEVNAEIKNDKNAPKAALQSNISVNQSCESTFEFPKSTIDMQNNNKLQILIQRCDSLITSLEKITADVKQEISSRSGQCFIKKCCCTNEQYSKFCGCCCSCIKDIQYCKKIKACKCSMIKNICTSSLPCKSIKEMHECCIEVKESMNLSRPCIVIPLQADHLQK